MVHVPAVYLILLIFFFHLFKPQGLRVADSSLGKIERQRWRSTRRVRIHRFGRYSARVSASSGWEKKTRGWEKPLVVADYLHTSIPTEISSTRMSPGTSLLGGIFCFVYSRSLDRNSTTEWGDWANWQTIAWQTDMYIFLLYLKKLPGTKSFLKIPKNGGKTVCKKMPKKKKLSLNPEIQLSSREK